MNVGIVLLVLLGLAFIIGWHLLFPIVGGIIAFTALAWGILLASIVIFCVAILLVFIFTGTGVFVLGVFAFVWMILAVIFFPIIFPVILPLFILFLLVSYFHRRKRRLEMEKAEAKNQGVNPPQYK